jgi:hypothetical protein
MLPKTYIEFSKNIFHLSMQDDTRSISPFGRPGPAKSPLALNRFYSPPGKINSPNLEQDRRSVQQARGNSITKAGV